MSIKVKFRGNGKATVKFGNPAEETWFKSRMAVIRDSDPKTHPQMIVRDEKGIHIPKIKPISLPQKLSPEQIAGIKNPPIVSNPQITLDPKTHSPVMASGVTNPALLKKVEK